MTCCRCRRLRFVSSATARTPRYGRDPAVIRPPARTRPSVGRRTPAGSNRAHRASSCTRPPDAASTASVGGRPEVPLIPTSAGKGPQLRTFVAHGGPAETGLIPGIRGLRPRRCARLKIVVFPVRVRSCPLRRMRKAPQPRGFLCQLGVPFAGSVRADMGSAVEPGGPTRRPSRRRQARSDSRDVPATHSRLRYAPLTRPGRRRRPAGLRLGRTLDRTAHRRRPHRSSRDHVRHPVRRDLPPARTAGGRACPGSRRLRARGAGAATSRSRVPRWEPNER
jgi:hypothetical protein